LLNGLATAAAVARSSQLADHVRTLARVVRQRSPKDLSPASIARIALVAAASRSVFDEWARFTGEWITELAFVEMSDAESMELMTVVQTICELEPILWETCSRAISALAAFSASFPVRIPSGARH